MDQKIKKFKMKMDEALRSGDIQSWMNDIAVLNY